MRNLLIFGLFSLAAANMARAQQHAAMTVAAPPPAMHARPVAAIGTAHVAPSHPPNQVHSGTPAPAPGMRTIVTHRTPAHPVSSQPLTPRNTHFNNSGWYYPGLSSSCNYNPAPGLGFDYTHFFAVHPNWGVCQSVTGVVLPFFGGGGFYLPVSYYSEPVAQEQAQEAAPNDQQDSGVEASVQEPAALAYSRSRSYTPSEPVAEYVFVKRDGTQVNAVAYILLKDSIQCVTKEGLRRTFALDTLDFESTQKLNEERGNTINLPALSSPSWL